MGKKAGGKNGEVKVKRKGGGGKRGGSMRAQLARLGLVIKDITGDGSCFFRSLSDQLYGTEDRHLELRRQITEYMQENEEFYKLFLEDDEPFPKYLARMKKEGTWAGNIELQVATCVLSANIVVHQEDQPPWVLRSEKPSDTWLHLAYKFELHYDSVREHDAVTGPTEFPSLDVVLARALAGSGESVQTGTGGDETTENPWDTADEEYVVSCTGCEDVDRVRAALKVARGNRDEAIESVIASMCGLGSDSERPTPAAADTDAPSVSRSPVTEQEPTDISPRDQVGKPDTSQTAFETISNQPTHSYNLRSTARRRKEQEERSNPPTPSEQCQDTASSTPAAETALHTKEESEEGTREAVHSAASGSESEQEEEAQAEKKERRKVRRVTKAEKKAAKKAAKAKSRKAQDGCANSQTAPGASALVSRLSAIHI